MRSQAALSLILSFLISAGLIGFAIAIYKDDHATSLGIIGVVSGHWLGVGSVATGKSLSELASSQVANTISTVSQAVKEAQQ